MACPSCGSVLMLTHPELEASSKTHDTSTTRYHITFPQWLKQVDQAIQCAWPKRFDRYTRVAVLMISWQETYQHAMKTEIHRLASVFRDVYGFSVTKWWIPSVNPDRATSKMINDFLDKNEDPQHLLIVYYAGHARHNPSGGYFPIWQPRPIHEKGKQVDTATFHPLLVRAQDDSPDVVLLYDCCFALSSHRSNSNRTQAEVEGLFAGGFESEVPIAGQDSFTKHLTDALATAPESDRPLTIVELHRQIIVRLQTFHEQAIFDANNEVRRCGITGKVLHTKSVRVTPSHLFLAGNEKPRLIALVPLDSDNNDNKTSDSEQYGFEWPKVLLAIRLINDNSVEREFKNWILNAPPGVVEYHGILPSYSSLLLVGVSVVIWDLLPPCPAVTFVSFITGPITNPQLNPSDDLISPNRGSTSEEKSSLTYLNQDHTTMLETDPRMKSKQENTTETVSAKPQSPASSSSQLQVPAQAGNHLFRTPTSSQRTLIHLLDRADVHIRQILQDWRALPDREEYSRDVWLIYQLNMRLDAEGMDLSQSSIDFIAEHQEFLSRYLSTHEFLSHDSPLLNLASRLNPLFSFRFEGAEGQDPSGSVTTPSTMLSSFWSSRSRDDMNSGYAPSLPAGAIVYEEDLPEDFAKDGDGEASNSNIPECEPENKEPTRDIKNRVAISSTRQPDIPATTRLDDKQPNLSVSPLSHIVNNGPVDLLVDHDSRFVVADSRQFQRGEVFKILWSEPSSVPKGDTIGDASSGASGASGASRQFSVGYRRFIVVTTDEGSHSTCVPILTYDRRGCTKRGVKPSKHGIIYAQGQKPKLLRHEPALGFDPVAVEIYAEGETLVRESRVNYSKLVTIEHRVKVFFIGRINDPDIDTVVNAVDTCWNKKMHERQKNK